MKKRILASVLSLVYLLSNVILAHAAETNFWNDRRQVRHYAAMPKPLPALPVLKPVLSLKPSPVSTFKSQNTNTLTSSLRRLVTAVALTHGSIQKIHDAGASQNPPVVLLQDIHLNTEAQMNTAHLLQELIHQQQVGRVGVEGAFGPFDFAPFRKHAHTAEAKNVLEDVLKQNLIGAPSFVGITSAIEPPVIIGVDDAAHYQANLDALYAAKQKKDDVIKRLQIEKNDLQQRKAIVFSKELLEFDALRSQYHSGVVDISPYVQRLSQYGTESEFVVDQFLEAVRLEARLPFDQVESERRIVMERLANKLTESEIAELTDQSLAYRVGRLGFGAYYAGVRALCQKKDVRFNNAPHFADYLRYVLLSDGINADHLFDAIQLMEQRVVDTLAKTPLEKDLIRQGQILVLSEKLINFSLTAKEWEQYNKIIKNQDPTVNPFDLTAFENFYREADIRSEKMVNNLFFGSWNLDLPKPSVLVVGGFHTPHVSELLRQKKISYVVVSPKLTSVDDASGSAYLSVFAREKTPLDRLFAGEKLFLAPSHLAVGTSAKVSALTGLLLGAALAVLPGNAVGQEPTAQVVHEQNRYTVTYAPTSRAAVRWGSVGINKASRSSHYFLLALIGMAMACISLSFTIPKSVSSIMRLLKRKNFNRHTFHAKEQIKQALLFLVKSRFDPRQTSYSQPNFSYVVLFRLIGQLRPADFELSDVPFLNTLFSELIDLPAKKPSASSTTIVLIGNLVNKIPGRVFNAMDPRLAHFAAEQLVESLGEARFEYKKEALWTLSVLFDRLSAESFKKFGPQFITSASLSLWLHLGDPGSTLYKTAIKAWKKLVHKNPQLLDEAMLSRIVARAAGTPESPSWEIAKLQSLVPFLYAFRHQMVGDDLRAVVETLIKSVEPGPFALTSIGRFIVWAFKREEWPQIRQTFVLMWRMYRETRGPQLNYKLANALFANAWTNLLEAVQPTSDPQSGGMRLSLAATTPLLPIVAIRDKAVTVATPPRPQEQTEEEREKIISALKIAASDLGSSDEHVRLLAVNLVYDRIRNLDPLFFKNKDKGLLESILSSVVKNIFSKDTLSSRSSKALLEILVIKAKVILKSSNRRYFQSVLKTLVAPLADDDVTVQGNALFALGLLIKNSSAHILRSEKDGTIHEMIQVLTEFLSHSDVEVRSASLNVLPEFMKRVRKRYWLSQNMMSLDALVARLFENVKEDAVLGEKNAQVLLFVLKNHGFYRFGWKQYAMLMAMLNFFIPQLASGNAAWGKTCADIVSLVLLHNKIRFHANDHRPQIEKVFQNLLPVLRNPSLQVQAEGIKILRGLLGALPANYFGFEDRALLRDLLTIIKDSGLIMKSEHQSNLLSVLEKLLDRTQIGLLTTEEEPMIMGLIEKILFLRHTHYNTARILRLLFQRAPPEIFSGDNNDVVDRIVHEYLSKIYFNEFNHHDLQLLEFLFLKYPGYLTIQTWEILMKALWKTTGSLIDVPSQSLVRVFSKNAPSPELRSLAEMMSDVLSKTRTPRDITIQTPTGEKVVRVSRAALHMFFRNLGQENGPAKPMHQLILAASRQRAQIQNENPKMAEAYFWQVWAHALDVVSPTSDPSPSESGFVVTPLLFVIVIAFMFFSAMPMMAGAATGVAAFGVLHLGRKRKSMDKKTTAFFRNLKDNPGNYEEVLRRERSLGDAVFNHLTGSLYHPRDGERRRSMRRLLQWYSKGGSFSKMFFRKTNRRVFGALIDNLAHSNPDVFLLANDVIYWILKAVPGVLTKDDGPLLIKGLVHLAETKVANEEQQRTTTNLIPNLAHWLAGTERLSANALDLMEKLLQTSTRLESHHDFRGPLVLQELFARSGLPLLTEGTDIERVRRLLQDASGIMAANIANATAWSLVLGLRKYVPIRDYVESLDVASAALVVQGVIGDFSLRLEGRSIRKQSLPASADLLTNLLSRFPHLVTKRNFQLVAAELWADQVLPDLSKEELALVDLFVQRLPSDSDRAMASAIRVGLTFPANYVLPIFSDTTRSAVMLGGRDIARFVGRAFDRYDVFPVLETTLTAMGRQYLELSRNERRLATLTLMNAWAILIQTISSSRSQETPESGFVLTPLLFALSAVVLLFAAMPMVGAVTGMAAVGVLLKGKKRQEAERKGAALFRKLKREGLDYETFVKENRGAVVPFLSHLTGSLFHSQVAVRKKALKLLYRWYTGWMGMKKNVLKRHNREIFQGLVANVNHPHRIVRALTLSVLGQMFGNLDQGFLGTKSSQVIGQALLSLLGSPGGPSQLGQRKLRSIDQILEAYVPNQDGVLLLFENLFARSASEDFSPFDRYIILSLKNKLNEADFEGANIDRAGELVRKILDGATDQGLPLGSITLLAVLRDHMPPIDFARFVDARSSDFVISSAIRELEDPISSWIDDQDDSKLAHAVSILVELLLKFPERATRKCFQDVTAALWGSEFPYTEVDMWRLVGVFAEKSPSESVRSMASMVRHAMEFPDGFVHALHEGTREIAVVLGPGAVCAFVGSMTKNNRHVDLLEQALAGAWRQYAELTSRADSNDREAENYGLNVWALLLQAQQSSGHIYSPLAAVVSLTAFVAFVLPVWGVVLAFVLPLAWPRKKQLRPSVQRLLDAIDTTPLNLEVGRVTSANGKNPQILLHLVDDSTPAKSLAQAQDELQKFAATGAPIAVRFLSGNPDLRRQLANLSATVASNVTVTVFDRARAATLSRALLNRVVSKDEFDRDILHFVAPAHLAQDLNEFLDLPIDPESRRFRIYLLLMDGGKSLFFQLGRNRLQRPAELLQILQKVLQNA